MQAWRFAVAHFRLPILNSSHNSLERQAPLSLRTLILFLASFACYFLLSFYEHLSVCYDKWDRWFIPSDPLKSSFGETSKLMEAYGLTIQFR
jgi:hypothetical protein